MSLLSRCAVITLVLCCTACSGIPVNETAADTVSYPSGCTDGCEQECLQDTQAQVKNQETHRQVPTAVYWTLSTACIPAADAAPPAVKPTLGRPLPFE